MEVEAFTWFFYFYNMNAINILLVQGKKFIIKKML
jgi:hypothetical protein